MLDSALGPSYNLSKNLLLLPLILKLKGDMVNDLTPLYSVTINCANSLRDTGLYMSIFTNMTVKPLS